MERIFKIKTKSNPDPRGQYPSERRYSASTVIGLSVVYLQFFIYSVLMGTLIVQKMSLRRLDIDVGNITWNDTVDSSPDNNTDDAIRTGREDALVRLGKRLAKDLGHLDDVHYYINIPALVGAGCFIMAVGSLLSFATGVVAWKRWYVDHNITFFFLSTTFSTLTSAVCLMLSLLTTFNMNINCDKYECKHTSPITFSLALNIIVLSSAGLIWSIVSTRVAYLGMKNDYPDDMVISKGGRTVEVSTITKGGKRCSTFPPDIISHFPVSDKLAKYLPKKDNSGLPKAESNYEYQQRVDKFLSGDVERNEDAK